MSDVLTIPDALSIGHIIGAATGTKRVARLVGDDVIEGTARSIGDDRGAFLASGEDVRDGFLRVTTLAGWEAFWPVRELIRDHQDTTFVVRD